MTLQHVLATSGSCWSRGGGCKFNACVGQVLDPGSIAVANDPLGCRKMRCPVSSLLHSPVVVVF